MHRVYTSCILPQYILLFSVTFCCLIKFFKLPVSLFLYGILYIGFLNRFRTPSVFLHQQLSSAYFSFVMFYNIP